VMYAGKVVESGDLRDLVTAPRHPYTFSLLRSVPDPDQRVARLLSIQGRPPDLAEPISGCSFAVRCPFAEDACHEWEPELVPAGPARHSACRRTDTAKRWGAMVAAEAGR
jgi:oligopeptide/dipeptide ABC transporter ATP-binding protein